jgi:hypothetical protein
MGVGDILHSLLRTCGKHELGQANISGLIIDMTLINLMQ